MQDGFIYFDNESRPRMVYTPYVYSSIVDCSKHYMIFKKGEARTVLKKEVEKNVKKRRHNSI
mgnify:CR=1 FL=1